MHTAKTCQRCTACEGQEHHWMPEPEHDLGLDELFYECKHCPAQCDADSTDDGWTPGAMRRVLALAPGEQMAEFCAGCGQLVDHETCGCGVDRAQHNQDVLGHAFVSDGCRCLDVEYTDAKALVALRSAMRGMIANVKRLQALLDRATGMATSASHLVEDDSFDDGLDEDEDEGSLFREDINQIRAAAGLPVLPGDR